LLDGYNLYQYAPNGLTWIDPFGLIHGHGILMEWDIILFYATTLIVLGWQIWELREIHPHFFIILIVLACMKNCIGLLKWYR